jgi:branched-chain amino acid transport system ATP-binding protein
MLGAAVCVAFVETAYQVSLGEPTRLPGWQVLGPAALQGVLWTSGPWRWPASCIGCAGERPQCEHPGAARPAQAFGLTEIIRGTDLTVRHHERLALIGPNGAGKSTLFALISGQLAPDAGCIELDGRDLAGAPPHAWRAPAWDAAFQVSNLFGALSVRDNLRCAAMWSLGQRLSLWSRLRRSRALNERVDQCCPAGLAERAETPAVALSYAEQRVLEIGLTAAGNPHCLLLDEPTSGMSRAETQRVIALVRRISEGRTLVMIEHDMNVVFGLADRIAVLVYGQVIAVDTPEAIRRDPRSASCLPGPARASRRPAMLEIEGLSAWYGASQVLFGVSLSVGAGEVLTLVGRNGAGRSTLARALVGRVRRQGSVRLNGRELVHEPSHRIARAGIGYVPENREVFGQLNVEENLLLGEQAPAATGARLWNLARCYALFPRLQERRLAPAAALSGGEQQMLVLCRALMGNPRLLVIDEPTEGLSPHDGAALVARTLAQLKQEGLSAAAHRAEARHRAGPGRPGGRAGAGRARLCRPARGAAPAARADRILGRRCLTPAITPVPPRFFSPPGALP